MYLTQESQKKAARKWDGEHMATLGCKVKKEQADAFRDYCKARNKTPNSELRDYVLDCIGETIERDNGCINPLPSSQSPIGAVSGPSPAQLTDTARNAAVAAAEASGEELPVFVERAILTQAKRDKLSRSLGQTVKEAGE